MGQRRAFKKRLREYRIYSSAILIVLISEKSVKLRRWNRRIRYITFLEESRDVSRRDLTKFSDITRKGEEFSDLRINHYFFWRTKMRIVKTADDALHEINKNFMKLDDVDIAKSNQIVDFLKIDVVSYFE